MPGGALEKYRAVRSAQRMTTAAIPFNIYQLRVALRGISPVIWRRARAARAPMCSRSRLHIDVSQVARSVPLTPSSARQKAPPFRSCSLPFNSWQVFCSVP
jgi:hypothetical protein